MRLLSPKGLCALSLMFAAFTAGAQIQENDSWRIGVSAGMHTSFMRISGLDKEIFPKSNDLVSGAFSIFAQKAWGENLNWAIRPELAFANRGGSLVKIMSDVPGYYQQHGYSNFSYKVSGHYFDLRLPIMYRFGSLQSRWRPYAYIAPIIGFAHGGSISRDITSASGVDRMKISASTANMAKTYFSGAIGLGADWRFTMAGEACSLGAELMYEMGFTDTYGRDASASKRIPVVEGSEWAHFADNSKRKYNGLEVKLTFSVPLSIFSPKKNPAPAPQPYEEPIPASAPQPVPEPAPQP
ncbi:MAG: outer membrane beta-barrel protein, partial [Clostridium sp.]|nr:outer membrane beta-barrel protein [Clostridium sp.]